jgi:hypothetical protein
MGSNCVLGARLSMKANVLKPLAGDVIDDPAQPNPPVIPGAIGHWEYSQDPDSGAIEKKWVGDVIDDPITPDIDESNLYYNLNDVRCEVRGVMQGGIRVAGTTQRYSEIYENVEWANATFDKSVNITKNDKVTNIRNADGLLIWRNEEGDGGPTTFNVMGVTPALDPFGKLTEWKVLLQRAEVQGV